MDEAWLPYINYLLIGLIFLSLGRRLFFTKPARPPILSTPGTAGHSAIAFKTYTPRSLAPFTGAEGPTHPVLLAVKGTVFDVSSSRQFYGPGSSYENFAGRDASRGLAKNSFDAEVLTPLDEPIDELKDLTKEEEEALQGWFTMFENKYAKVGKLVNETAKTK